MLDNKIIIELGLLFTCIIIYIISMSVFITGPYYNLSDLSNIEVGLGIFGFFCGIWLSVFLHRTIFNDEDESKNIVIILSIGIISSIIMSVSLISNLYSIKGVVNLTWIQYNQILFPLYGGLIFIIEEAFTHLIHFILKEKTYNTSFRKIDTSSDDSNLSSISDQDPSSSE
jgi:hypothetical protein